MTARSRLPRLSLVVAMARNRVIGRDGALPWRIPGDMRYFKRVTMGKPLVMGRKTFQSIGRPLPGRANIVVTRDTGFAADGVTVAHGVDAAVAIARDIARHDGVDEIMVVGGGEIYAAVLPAADRIYLTEVAVDVAGDALFPAIARDAWRETTRTAHPADGAAPAHAFVTLERVKATTA